MTASKQVWIFLDVGGEFEIGDTSCQGDQLDVPWDLGRET